MFVVIQIYYFIVSGHHTTSVEQSPTCVEPVQVQNENNTNQYGNSDDSNQY